MSICIICNKQINQLQERNRTRCNSCNTKIRRYRNKLKAVEFLGGKCVKCGFNNPAALEFHHKDPKQKDFTIGNVANKSWDVIVKEISKCELLCSNCHRIEHTTRYEESFVKAVSNYGKLAK